MEKSCVIFCRDLQHTSDYRDILKWRWWNVKGTFLFVCMLRPHPVVLLTFGFALRNESCQGSVNLMWCWVCCVQGKLSTHCTIGPALWNDLWFTSGWRLLPRMLRFVSDIWVPCRSEESWRQLLSCFYIARMVLGLVIGSSFSLHPWKEQRT